jgi:hypothetical protein
MSQFTDWWNGAKDTSGGIRGILADPTEESSLVNNLYSWISGSGAKKAAAETKAGISANMDWLKSNYNSARSANEASYSDRMNAIGGFSSKLDSMMFNNRRDATTSLDQYGSAVQSQLAGQTGVYKTSLDQILNSVRSKSASTGFIGGTQEARIMNPLVSQLSSEYTKNYADTLSGYQASRLNTLLGLGQSEVAGLTGVEQLRQAAYGQYGSQNTSLATSAMGAFGSLNESQAKAAGAHNEGGVGNIMGILASIFGG